MAFGFSMIKINIICAGKIKEKFFSDAVAEYSKRLSKYCNLNIIEVADEKTPDNASAAQEEQIKQKEAERILKNIKQGSYVISLEIDGKMMGSVTLANHISSLSVSGKSDITFIIGGSLGLHKSVSDVSNLHLSFSEMTFPHQLMRVILLEQIYRSFRIMSGEPYHK